MGVTPPELGRIELAIEASTLGARARSTKNVDDRLRGAALALFAEKGFDRTTVQEIAERAGVTSRTFFRYFPAKETVLIDIVDQTSTRLMGLIAAEAPGAPLVAVLEAAIRRWYTEYADLFPLVSRISAESRSLTAAILLRQSDWEAHMIEALGDRFPATDPLVLHLWGLTGYSLIRLVPEIAAERGVSMADAVAPAFISLAEVARSAARD
jgi:AcrR family transcriptional regulator